MKKETSAKPNYRKVVADLHSCEERYKSLVDSIPGTDDTRLQSALSALQSEVRQRQRLEAELLVAVETERQRIGHDLNDDLCQRLGAAAMMTSVVAKRIAGQDAAIGKELEKIPKLINDTIESCRALARGLHPTTLSANGLPAALEELASRMPEGIKFRWPKGKKIDFEPSVALHLYRITEEAVGNAIKHGRAKEIRVELDVLPDGTVLVISDNGQGFDQDLVTKGMGLRNIHFRAGAIGAELTFARARPEERAYIAGSRTAIKKPHDLAARHLGLSSQPLPTCAEGKRLSGWGACERFPGFKWIVIRRLCRDCAVTSHANPQCGGRNTTGVRFIFVARRNLSPEQGKLERGTMRYGGAP